jgi:hypothetical protein
MSHHDKPLAAPGLTSFRYKGRYGYVMIGATDTEDALREARRSVDGPALIQNLDIWDDRASRYVPVS